MSTLINYTAWFNLFALALNLLNDPLFPEQLEFKSRWGDIRSLDLFSSTDSMALFIDIVAKENDQTILGYALIPWQEMSSRKNTTDISSLIQAEYQLYTVTPFAMIYRFDPHNRSKSAGVLADRASSILDEYFDHEGCQSVISSSDAYTSAFGVQVISMTEYPWYADLQVAVPGSNMQEINTLAEDFNCRMIRVNMIPESGITYTRWLVSDDNPHDKGSGDLENTLLPLFQAAVESCIHDRSSSNRKRVFEETFQTIGDVTSRSVHDCKNLMPYYHEMLKRILFYNPVDDMPFDPQNPFPDYIPKMTPDELLDFMPELGDEFTHLPPAEAEYISELVDRYKSYKKAARKNPGKWIEGNPILGGKAEEYQPSEEELILMEIGERIRKIAEKEGSSGIKASMKEQNCKKKKIKYRKFTFIHMDVMGSGRYFYVEKIDKISLKLF